jgi:peptide/nickel transport system substrate-binding protein
MVLAACGGADDDGAAPEPGEPAEPAEEPEAEETEEPMSGEPVYGGTLRYAFSADPLSVDHATQSGTPVMPRDAVQEKLYAFGADAVPYPYLASGHELSDDELTWTIHLREGILFHNGEEMTAEDVVASWERYQEVGSRLNEYEFVESINASGEYSVDIVTTSPNGGVLESLAAASGGPWTIIPKSSVDAMGPPWDQDPEVTPENMVGTGPYKYVEHDPERVWVFERFDDYWGGPPEQGLENGPRTAPKAAYIDRVEYYVITDPATRVSAVLADEVDIAAPISADAAEAVADEPGINIAVATEEGRRAYWKFNTTLPPFDNQMLRLAVRTGFDPEAAMAGFGPPEYWKVNCAPRLTELHFAYQDYCTDEYFPRDVEAARQMVEESGYDGTPVVLLASEARPEYPITIPMITYLEEIGINVEPRIVDGATYSEMRRDPASGWNIKIAGGQATTSVMYLNAPGVDRQNNIWPGLDPAFLDLIDQASAAIDLDVRRDLIHEAYEILMDAVVDIWVGDELTVALYRDRLHGIGNDDYEFNWFNA